MHKIVKPCGNRVLVRRTPAETQTRGGIYLPEAAQEKTTEGQIIALGPDVKKVLDASTLDGSSIARLISTAQNAADPVAALAKLQEILTHVAERGGESRLKLGDVVYFSRYGGTEMNIGGEAFVLLSEDDILCTIQDSEHPRPELPGRI